MNEKEIIESDLSKAEKARRLFDLGKSRKDVAGLVLGGNVGWAYNIEKEYKAKKEKEKTEGAAKDNSTVAVNKDVASAELKSTPAPAKKTAATLPPGKPGGPPKAAVKPVEGKTAKTAPVKKAAVKTAGTKANTTAKTKPKAKKGPRR